MLLLLKVISRTIVVICIDAIVPRHIMADSISVSIEESCQVEILEGTRENR